MRTLARPVRRSSASAVEGSVPPHLAFVEGDAGLVGLWHGEEERLLAVRVLPPRAGAAPARRHPVGCGRPARCRPSRHRPGRTKAAAARPASSRAITSASGGTERRAAEAPPVRPGSTGRPAYARPSATAGSRMARAAGKLSASAPSANKRARLADSSVAAAPSGRLPGSNRPSSASCTPKRYLPPSRTRTRSAAMQPPSSGRCHEALDQAAGVLVFHSDRQVVAPAGQRGVEICDEVGPGAPRRRAAQLGQAQGKFGYQFDQQLAAEGGRHASVVVLRMPPCERAAQRAAVLQVANYRAHVVRKPAGAGRGERGRDTALKNERIQQLPRSVRRPGNRLPPEAETSRGQRIERAVMLFHADRGKRSVPRPVPSAELASIPFGDEQGEQAPERRRVCVRAFRPVPKLGSQLLEGRARQPITIQRPPVRPVEAVKRKEAPRGEGRRRQRADGRSRDLHRLGLALRSLRGPKRLAGALRRADLGTRCHDDAWT